MKMVYGITLMSAPKLATKFFINQITNLASGSETTWIFLLLCNLALKDCRTYLTNCNYRHLFKFLLVCKQILEKLDIFVHLSQGLNK